MKNDKGCAECTDWGNGNCVSGCFEPVCTCTELQRMTVCHDMRNEPHVVGCPRWGTRKRVPTHNPRGHGASEGDPSL